MSVYIGYTCEVGSVTIIIPICFLYCCNVLPFVSVVITYDFKPYNYA